MKECPTEQPNGHIKKPIAEKTEKLESQASQKWNEYSRKAKKKLTNLLIIKKTKSFLSKLFWIALAIAHNLNNEQKLFCPFLSF